MHHWLENRSTYTAKLTKYGETAAAGHSLGDMRQHRQVGVDVDAEVTYRANRQEVLFQL